MIIGMGLICAGIGGLLVALSLIATQLEVKKLQDRVNVLEEVEEKK